MASKRASHEEGNDDRDRQVPGKRRHAASEAQEGTCTTAISNRTTERGINDIELLRNVIREELQATLQSYLSPCCGLSLNHQTGTSGGRALQLCFMNKLPPRIFTGSEIIAEDRAPLQIELRDATCQGRIAKEEGSSLKIQLCVLDGDFGSDGSSSYDWTAEEFNVKTLSPRKGKGPLLFGDTSITLKNGVGYVNEKIVFTDNSNWTRSGMFRLGVKVVQSTFIREGRSEPFKVQDNRREVYKKHDRPSLNDPVWRLKKVRKEGPIHKLLSSDGIRTVKDLLQLYVTNQASLQEKIGNCLRNSRKLWDTMIEHAKACDIDDDERYVYTCSTAERSISLVFNCIYEVVEVSFNGQNYCSLESLNLNEKRLVERVKQQAYKNLKDLIPHETTTHGLVQTSASVQSAQYDTTDQGLQQFGFPIAQQGQPETWANLCEPSPSTSHVDDAAQIDQLHSNQQPEINWSAGGHLITDAYNDDADEWILGGTNIDQLGSCITSPISMEQANLMCPPYGNGSECSNHFPFPNPAVYISSNWKRKTVWYKIRTAFKVILHVARRRANLFHRRY